MRNERADRTGHINQGSRFSIPSRSARFVHLALLSKLWPSARPVVGPGLVSSTGLVRQDIGAARVENPLYGVAFFINHNGLAESGRAYRR
jgi:hypothetical protein